MRAAIILVTALGVLLVGQASASAAPSFGWGPIIRCESGGKNIPTNGNSTASGYFQILDSTWRSHGGLQFSSRAMGTSMANQQVVAERVLADQGLDAWGPSETCWRNGVVRNTAVVHSTHKAPVRHRAYHHRHRGHHHS